MLNCYCHAKKYLEESNDPIPNPEQLRPVSYAQVSAYLSLLTASPYPQLSVQKVNYGKSIIGCFWNLDDSRLSFDFNTFDGFNQIQKKNLQENLKANNVEFSGDITYKVFGNSDAYAVHTRYGTKTTSDKKIIEAAVRWTYEYLNEYNQPGNIMFITEDTDIISAVLEAKKNHFRVLVAHGSGAITRELRYLKSFTYFRGEWETLASRASA